MIKTEIGFTTADAITVRGQDLTRDLIGHIDFVDMILLTSLGRICEPAEKVMLNAILVAVTDHGLTPSALAARLTYTGAPESVQGAVAAGLLGAGSVFLGAMQNASDMLTNGVRLAGPNATEDDFRRIAVDLVRSRQRLFGFGHNIHVRGDPRVAVLQQLAEENGCYGVHWRMLLAIDAAQRETRSTPLPINAAGAIGAVMADLGLPPALARGLALTGRCAGLIAHLLEEEASPVGRAVWHLVLEQDDRNRLDL